MRNRFEDGKLPWMLCAGCGCKCQLVSHGTKVFYVHTILNGDKPTYYLDNKHNARAGILGTFTSFDDLERQVIRLVPDIMFRGAPAPKAFPPPKVQPRLRLVSSH